jgi:hypothetical protein
MSFGFTCISESICHIDSDIQISASPYALYGPYAALAGLLGDFPPRHAAIRLHTAPTRRFHPTPYGMLKR